jgi:hypothetical protein
MSTTRSAGAPIGAYASIHWSSNSMRAYSSMPMEMLLQIDGDPAEILHMEACAPIGACRFNTACAVATACSSGTRVRVHGCGQTGAGRRVRADGCGQTGAGRRVRADGCGQTGAGE